MPGRDILSPLGTIGRAEDAVGCVDLDQLADGVAVYDPAGSVERLSHHTSARVVIDDL